MVMIGTMKQNIASKSMAVGTPAWVYVGVWCWKHTGHMARSFYFVRYPNTSNRLWAYFGVCMGGKKSMACGTWHWHYCQFK